MNYARTSERDGTVVKWEERVKDEHGKVVGNVTKWGQGVMNYARTGSASGQDGR